MGWFVKAVKESFPKTPRNRPRFSIASYCTWKTKSTDERFPKERIIVFFLLTHAIKVFPLLSGKLFSIVRGHGSGLIQSETFPFFPLNRNFEQHKNTNRKGIVSHVEFFRSWTCLNGENNRERFVEITFPCYRFECSSVAAHRRDKIRKAFWHSFLCKLDFAVKWIYFRLNEVNVARLWM